MNDAQAEHRERQAVRAVSRALMPDDQLRVTVGCAGHAQLLDRMSAILALIGDGIEEFRETYSRSRAWSLVLVTDFGWQVLRALAGRSGNDTTWINKALPQDHEASDADIGDSFFARQIEIVEDAKWIFDLHTGLRHPVSKFGDHLWLLREPIPPEHGDHLLQAATAIRAVFINVQARMNNKQPRTAREG